MQKQKLAKSSKWQLIIEFLEAKKKNQVNTNVSSQYYALRYKRKRSVTCVAIFIQLV